MTNSVGISNAVWPYYSSRNKFSVSESGGSNLGKDEFLKILITQLRYQDPMQPMQDREFIAQMAQFSSLEQMMNIGTEMSMLRQSLGIASSLIGKEVTWTTYSSTGAPTGEQTGIVEAIIMKNGEQLVKVNGIEISLDAITRIAAASGDVSADG